MVYPSKTSPLGENWLILGVMALVGLVLSGPGSGSEEPRRDFRLVPAPFEINHEMIEVAAIRKISRARIQQAMQLILKLEYDRALSTPDDEEIFRLLHQYEAGQRLYRTTAAVIISKNVGRMAFSCPEHEFAYNPDVQTSTPFLALSLYHELKQGVQCQQGIELPRTEDGQDALITRALENRVFIASSNRIGTEERVAGQKYVFTGKSRIVGPDGKILADGPPDAPALITAEIDPSQASDKKVTPLNHVFRDRRTDQYRM